MLSADLRQEYERQLQNIRTLRGLYEERARLAEVTRQALSRDLQEQKELHQAEVKKCVILLFYSFSDSRCNFRTIYFKTYLKFLDAKTCL